MMSCPVENQRKALIRQLKMRQVPSHGSASHWMTRTLLSPSSWRTTQTQYMGELEVQLLPDGDLVSNLTLLERTIHASSFHRKTPKTQVNLVYQLTLPTGYQLPLPALPSGTNFSKILKHMREIAAVWESDKIRLYL